MTFYSNGKTTLNRYVAGRFHMAAHRTGHVSVRLIHGTVCLRFRVHSRARSKLTQTAANDTTAKARSNNFLDIEYREMNLVSKSIQRLFVVSVNDRYP